MHWAYLGKISESQKVCGRAGSEQKLGLVTLFLEAASEIEQGSHTYTSAHKQQASLALLGAERKTVAERQEYIDAVSGLKRTEMRCAAAGTADKEVESILFGIDIVDRNRAAEENTRSLDGYLDKLARLNGRERCAVGRGHAEHGIGGMFAHCLEYREVLDLFH